jgi:tRNA(Ile)-lysidine synthase
MRLERGCDLKGLTGIHAVRDDGVVRPLMTVQGHELRDWLVLRGLAYREDSSNRDERFFRNRLRHGALARISAQDPEFVLRVAQSALQAQEKVRAMQPSINKWICEHVVKLPNGRIAFDKDAVRDAWFPRQAVAEVLRHESIPFGRRHIEAIVRCAGKPRATVLLPGNWRWEVESGNAELCGPLSTTGTGAPVWFGMNVPGTTPCGDWGTIEARICSPSEVRGRLRSPDNMMVYLDAARVEEELVARTCSPGEAFHPYGRPSSVRVGQFLKKQGIGKSCRDSMVVVAEQKGEIIWIPGVRTSARYAVDERTRAILELKCMRQGCRKGVC